MFIHGKPVVLSLVLILAVSMFWHYRSYVQQQSTEKSNTGLQSIILALQEQLHSTQKTLLATESELRELLAMDWQNKAMLQATQARDWQQKYLAREREQDNLLRERSKMEHQYEIDLARMQRGLDFQSDQNKKLRGDLADKDRKLDEQANKVMLHEASISTLAGTITGLENKLQKQDKIINQQVESKSAGTGKPPAQTIHSYRQVRLESLKFAMSDQDSNTRRIILADVIPTIPDGVNSDEFISLVTGMNSEDILTTIRTTEKYIARPFDNKFLALLPDLMDKSDVDEAVLILSKQQ